jgi:hypothetical protein
LLAAPSLNTNDAETKDCIAADSQAMFMPTEVESRGNVVSARDSKSWAVFNEGYTADTGS